MKRQLTEHQKYLDKLKKDKAIVIFFRIAILVIFLAVWELLADLKVIDSFLFSSPSRVLVTLFNLHSSGELYSHIFTTIFETLAGFFIASILGVLIAVVLWWSEKLRKIFEPYIVVLNSLPKIALGPMIIIWFGAGMKAIIFKTS